MHCQAWKQRFSQAQVWCQKAFRPAAPASLGWVRVQLESLHGPCDPNSLGNTWVKDVAGLTLDGFQHNAPQLTWIQSCCPKSVVGSCAMKIGFDSASYQEHDQLPLHLGQMARLLQLATSDSSVMAPWTVAIHLVTVSGVAIQRLWKKLMELVHFKIIFTKFRAEFDAW